MMNRRSHGRVVRRLERPLVLLSVMPEKSLRGLVDLVRQWDWDLRAEWITPGEWPADRPVAGALIGELPTSPLARRLIEEQCPVVRIGSFPHPGDTTLPAVLPDLAAAGRLAAEHFAARDFKHLAYVGFAPDGDALEHADPADY